MTKPEPGDDLHRQLARAARSWTARPRDAAEHVVALLGPDALWWSNHDTEISAWSAVAPCTFDGVVAGTNGVVFAALVQLAED